MSKRATNAVLSKSRLVELIQNGSIAFRSDNGSPTVNDASINLRAGEHCIKLVAALSAAHPRSYEEVTGELATGQFELLADGITLEQGCVYLINLLEDLDLPENIQVKVSPTLMAWRLGVQSRLIWLNERGRSRAWLEVRPGQCTIQIRRGSYVATAWFEAAADEGLFEVSLPADQKIFRSRKSSFRLSAIKSVHADFDDVSSNDDFSRSWSEIVESPVYLEPGQLYDVTTNDVELQAGPFCATLVPYDSVSSVPQSERTLFLDRTHNSGGPATIRRLVLRGFRIPFFLEEGGFVGTLRYHHLLGHDRQNQYSNELPSPALKFVSEES